MTDQQQRPSDKVLKEPTPIDNTTLSWDKDSPTVCWRFNEYRAMHSRFIDNPVTQVWATAGSCYTSDPTKNKSVCGSRDIGVLYHTEADAWEACCIAVERSYKKRLDELRDRTKKARSQKESPNDD